MKNHANRSAVRVSHVAFTAADLAAMSLSERVKVEIEEVLSEKSSVVMDGTDAALYDFGNAEGVYDTEFEMTDAQYADVLAGKAYAFRGEIRYFRNPKKTFHGIDIEAERERIRNANKLAEIADFLAGRGIVLNVPGRSVPTQSEIEVVWLP